MTPELSPTATDMLTKYATRTTNGDIKLALENLILKHARPEYQILAEELRELKQKRLAREDREFNKNHNGFRKHKNFGY